MPLLPYNYLHLVNCSEVVTISDNYCTDRLGGTHTDVRNSSKSTTPSRLASQRRKTLAARRAGLMALGKERLYIEWNCFAFRP